MEARTQLAFWVLVWAVTSGVLLLGQWKSKFPSASLPLTYTIAFSLIHFFGGLIYSLPWYEPQSLLLTDSGTSVELVAKGFRVSTIGMIGFVLGCLFVAPRFVPKRPAAATVELPEYERKRLPTHLLILGGIFFFILAPLLGGIPSIGAAIISGIGFAVAGLCLACWNAWQEQNKVKLFKFVSMTAIFPIVTTTALGFIGYGTTAGMAVWMFVFYIYRPRWHVVAALVFILYLGLSVFVTYFRDREEIREVVWSGDKEAGLIDKATDRLGRVIETFVNFEFMSFHDQRHLEYIDLRLNQNLFVANCVDYIGSGGADFAKGKTIGLAAVALIPRILWPNKPIHGGSGDLVANYTGREVAESASFGVGQVLEFYLNFGIIGVFIGYVILGAALRFCDIYAGRFLEKRDWWRFAAWFVIGIQMVNPGGSLAEIAGKIAASLVLITGLHMTYFKGLYLPIAYGAMGSRTPMRRSGKTKKPMSEGAETRPQRPVRGTAGRPAPRTGGRYRKLGRSRGL